MSVHSQTSDTNHETKSSSVTRQEDAKWVLEIQAGNQRAFTDLTTKHYEGAVRVAMGVVKDRNAAEDVVQEAFTKVFLKIGQLEKPASFKSWLYKIVFNIAIDAYRSNRSRKYVSIADESARDTLNQNVDIWVGYEQSNPSNIFERRELTDTLEGSFATLSPKHREILSLREIEGLSYDEISTELGISRGTVMSRLHHARKLMQTKLIRKFKQESAVDYLDTLVQPYQLSAAC